MAKDHKIKIPQKAMDALNDSIHGKWAKIIGGMAGDDGAENCSCCKYARGDLDLCDKCPIVLALGKEASNCNFKEYLSWRRHYRDYHNTTTNKGILCYKCVNLAKIVQNRLIEIQDMCIVKKEDKLDTFNKMFNSIKRQFSVDKADDQFIDTAANELRERLYNIHRELEILNVPSINKYYDAMSRVIEKLKEAIK